MSNKKYDAIVIGSGMGGLAFAAVMSKLAGKRVLVLERHFKAGGFTHTFPRPGGWAWDVGLHYVGDVGAGSRSAKLFDYITGRNVRWQPMPDSYDHFHYPALNFNVPTGRPKFEAELIGRFPEESAAIRRYFRDIKSTSSWVARQFAMASTPGVIAAAIRLINRLTNRLPLTTTGDYLNSRFQSAELRAVLASQWGDYGLPPAQSAFAIHALIVGHYLNGAYYPKNGSGVIAEGALRVIREAGGDVLVNHEVQQILVEKGRAIGVQVKRQLGKTAEIVRFDANVIVSDAGAATTFQKLLPAEVPVPFRQELRALTQNVTSVATLYVGFKRDPRELGFCGENHWIFDSLDHDSIMANANDLLNGKAHTVYLSFPSLKNPLSTHHTAELIAPLSAKDLARFRDLPWRRRGAEYERIKQNIAQGMLSLAEKHLPGLRELIEFQEVSTPLSVEHFTGHGGGGIYGIPATPERFRQEWLAPKTHIPGLFLTGSDAGSLGIIGAMMGGVAAASQLLGPFGFFRIMAAAARESARTPAAAKTVIPDPLPFT